MNFNFNSKQEYSLNTSLVEEMINLYGILTKFLVVEKINEDDVVFGDYSHLKSDSEKIYDMYMLPENSEDWDSEGYNYDLFGITNFENITLFVAKSNFENEDHNEFHEIVGNLLVFPNNKIMEITDVDPTVPGINNLFTYNDAKSVYKITCKPHSMKLINEIDNVDISTEDNVPYETLDNYFNELIDTAVKQDEETEILPSVDTVKKEKTGNTIIKKPIIDTTEDDVFGSF